MSNFPWKKAETPVPASFPASQFFGLSKLPKATGPGSCRDRRKSPGQGLGRLLLETAEVWARQQGLPRISLSVGTHNKLAQRLYQALGYQVDILRMTKKLDTQQHEHLLTD